MRHGERLIALDKWQAQYNFWSSFGVPAYQENSVPDRDTIAYPYITYPAFSAPFDGDVAANASIWTRSASWERADALADAVQNRLQDGGQVVPYDGGVIWVTAEDAFAQSMGDPNDDLIKRKLLSVVLHFS